MSTLQLSTPNTGSGSLILSGRRHKQFQSTTCRIEVHKVGDGILLGGEGGGAGGARGLAQVVEGPAPGPGTTADGERVRPLPRLLAQPQRVQPGQGPAVTTIVNCYRI